MISKLPYPCLGGFMGRIRGVYVIIPMAELGCTRIVILASTRLSLHTRVHCRQMYRCQ